jgi:outer membrane protein
MLRAALLAVLLPLPAFAQSLDASGGPRLAFTLGAGVSAVPGYFGSDEAAPGFDLDVSSPYLSLGPLSFGSDGEGDAAQGLGFRGSFRYIPERSSEDYEELAGLEDVDAALEIGGGLSYAQPWWEAFAVARYGVLGHGALVGEVGLDLIARPTDRLTLRAGPRLFLGSDDFAATYFGVTEAEAARSDFAAFDAEGGLLSTGLEASATYRLTEAWGVTGEVRYDRLQNDAAESPITAEDDQFSASVMVTRRIDLRF